MSFREAQVEYSLLIRLKFMHPVFNSGGLALNRSVFSYLRVLRPNGSYVTVGGATAKLFQVLLVSSIIRLFTRKNVRVLALKPNKDLGYMSGLLDAGEVKPVNDGPYNLSNAIEAVQHFGEGNHNGKIITTMDDGRKARKGNG